MTHWCALVRWIHYPLLISLIKIEKEKKKTTFHIWSYSSILGGCNVIFSTWSVTFPVFSLRNSSNFQHFLKNRDMDNTSVTKGMRRTHTHNPPPPLQLLGCGGGGREWGRGMRAPTSPPAFGPVLVGFRAGSAGMGWTHATHSCAAVCSLLAYLCQTPTNTRRRMEPSRRSLLRL